MSYLEIGAKLGLLLLLSALGVINLIQSVKLYKLSGKKRSLINIAVAGLLLLLCVVLVWWPEMQYFLLVLAVFNVILAASN